MIDRIIYDTFMIPFERYAGLDRCRGKLIPLASGRVLEAGPGTGVNARYYDAEKIEQLVLVSPGRDRHRLASRAYGNLRAEYVDADVQSLPFDDSSFDTVVATLLFCSVPDPEAGLRELRRVLRPGGTYIYIEHIKPSGSLSSNFASFFTPYWKKIAGGCHLDRETHKTMSAAGFTVTDTCPYSKGVFIGGTAT